MQAHPCGRTCARRAGGRASAQRRGSGLHSQVLPPRLHSLGEEKGDAIRISREARSCWPLEPPPRLHLG